MCQCIRIMLFSCQSAFDYLRLRLRSMIEETFYQTLLDHLFDGVYFVDSSRRITSWNKGAESLTGYTCGETLGHNCPCCGK